MFWNGYLLDRAEGQWAGDDTHPIIAPRLSFVQAGDRETTGHVPLCISLCVCLSVSVSVSVCLSVCLSPSLSPARFSSPPLPASVCLSVSVCLSLSVPVSVSLSVSVSLWLAFPAHSSLPLGLSVCQSVCLSPLSQALPPAPPSTIALPAHPFLTLSVIRVKKQRRRKE